MNRLIIIVVCIAAAVGGLVYWRMTTAHSQELVARTALVEQGTLTATVGATGNLQPEDVVDVGAQVAGRIVEFGVDLNGQPINFNSQVKKGMLLARLDEELYRAELDQARGNLEQAEGAYFQSLAQVKQAKANLERAEADLEQLDVKNIQYKREWERVERQSMRPGTISDSEKDLAKANYEIARATLAVGKATISQARAAIEDSRANVLRTSGAYDASRAALRKAETNLSYCSIRSPVDGTIISRRVNAGQTVVASLNAPSLFLIAKDLNKMRIWAAVNEADVEQIKKGQKVRFTVEGRSGEVFEGMVLLTRLDPTSTQNVVSYIVEVGFDNARLKLLPYLNTNVTFEIAKKKDVLMVSNAALRWQPRRDHVHPDYQDQFAKLSRARGRPTAGGTEKDLREGFVWVEAGENYVRPVKVKTGLSDSSMTEIESDELKENDRVVIGVEQKAGSEEANPFAPRMMGSNRGSRQ